MSHNSDTNIKSKVTNRQKNRRTTDIRPSCMYPDKKSSLMKLIECCCRAEIIKFVFF